MWWGSGDSILDFWLRSLKMDCFFSTDCSQTRYSSINWCYCQINYFQKTPGTLIAEWNINHNMPNKWFLSICKQSVSLAAGEGGSSESKADSKKKKKKEWGKAKKDRLADEDDSLSATVNNTISSSLLSFLLYFKPVGLLPPPWYINYSQQKAFKELARVSLSWTGFI